jgi:hypothetical protein
MNKSVTFEQDDFDFDQFDFDENNYLIECRIYLDRSIEEMRLYCE